MHDFSHQFPIASIPDTLELKSNHVKRRRGHWCNFIKKKEFKYTSGKSIPINIKLSLLLTIDSKNYNSYPKISTKSAATVAFGRNVFQGYSFKNDSQFNSCYFIAMWCCGCSASQAFVFHSLELSYRICWHCDIKLPLLSMTKLDYFTSIRDKNIVFSLSFFRECVNLGYIDWTKAQISLPILYYLLVYAY